MYWFELDLDRYTRALDRITNTGTEVIQEWEAREKLLKSPDVSRKLPTAG